MDDYLYYRARLVTEPAESVQEEPVLESSVQEVVFDREVFMERLGGDLEMAQEILNIFLVDTPEQMGQLKQALESRNPEETARLGHKLKGSFSSLGADVAQGIAYGIEVAGKNGQAEEALLLFQKLEEGYRTLKQVLVVSGFRVDA